MDKVHLLQLYLEQSTNNNRTELSNYIQENKKQYISLSKLKQSKKIETEKISCKLSNRSTKVANSAHSPIPGKRIESYRELNISDVDIISEPKYNETKRIDGTPSVATPKVRKNARIEIPLTKEELDDVLL